MSPNDFVIGEIICALPRPFGKALAGTAPRRYIPMRHLSMNLKEKANAVVTRVDWPCIKYSIPVVHPSTAACKAFAVRPGEVQLQTSVTNKLVDVPLWNVAVRDFASR
jgi:hypothetical protein